MKPLIVNMFAGPGAGKSTMTASVFASLKWNDINCEMALEYAKECVWFGMENLLSNQTGVYGKQHEKIFHLSNKVDVIVTDSPLLLSIIYDKVNDKGLRNKVLQDYLKCNNVNYFLNRVKKYNTSGRMQTESEAKVIDKKVKTFLVDHGIPFKELAGCPENAEIIVKDILSLLKLKKKDLIPAGIPIMLSQ